MDAQPPPPRDAAAAVSLARPLSLQVDLTAGTNSTLPVENLSNIKVLALNPAGTLLLSFDEVRVPTPAARPPCSPTPARTGARCS